MQDLMRRLLERGQWFGPIARLGSYGWAYAAQFLLTLALGLEAFAAYVTATALAMLLAYSSMAGVSDIMTRKWPEFSVDRVQFISAVRRFLIPRLIGTLIFTGLISYIILSYGFADDNGSQSLWVFIALFGLLAVSIDLIGAVLACLGKPSAHAIVSNGLLGAAFFAGSIYAWSIGTISVNVILLHIFAQIAALILISGYLLLSIRDHYRSVNPHKFTYNTGEKRRFSGTVTLIHVIEISRAHLPVLLLQAAFQSAVSVALITSIRFSRAADVMSVLAIAQYTKRIISDRDVARGHVMIRRLCLILTSFAMVPLGIMIGYLCKSSGLDWETSILITSIVLASGILRQFIAVEVWMSKIVFNPINALKVNVSVEAFRLLLFFAVSTTGSVFASVLTFVLADILLIVLMLNLTSKRGKL